MTTIDEGTESPDGTGPTVFLVLPSDFSVRNFVFTGVLESLIEDHDAKVVLFTDEPELDRYLDENVDHFGLPEISKLSPSWLLQRSRLSRFRYLHANTATNHKLNKWRRQKPKRFLLEAGLARPFPRSQTIDEALQTLSVSLASPDERVEDVFDRFDPDLVFDARPTRMFAFEFHLVAQDRGIPTIGMIHSWDVVTTDGCLPIRLDDYLVWNERVKAELHKLHDFPTDRIHVTGVPQFDVYAREEPRISRRSLFKRYGLDPERPLVLYATTPEFFSPEDPQIAKALYESMREHPRLSEAQLLLRVHPQGNRGRFRELNEEGVPIQRSAQKQRDDDDSFLMTREHLDRLHATLSYTDVVVSVVSTMALDATAADTPVVKPAFKGEDPRFPTDLSQYYDYPHMSPIKESTATPLAGDLEELVDHVDRYVEDPCREAEARQSLRERLCHRVDGRAAKRVAETIARLSEERANQGEAS